jgi:pimeloyl-ACP methyl ester carboxylesterase
MVEASLKTLDVRGVTLAYIDSASELKVKEIPVLLIHGFASNHAVNWVNTQWVSVLNRAGYRVLALDNRGHGGSTKFYDPELYTPNLMAEDARGLLDSLDIPQAHVMGYSMGARISAHFASLYPLRTKSLLLGGLGIHLLHDKGLPPSIAEAMEAPSLDVLTDPIQRMFRAFAEQNDSDLKALAACMRGSRRALPRESLRRLNMPTLISVGTNDPIAGSPDDLAKLLPRGEAFHIIGRDHNLAVGDKYHKERVLQFLMSNLTPPT